MLRFNLGDSPSKGNLPYGQILLSLSHFIDEKQVSIVLLYNIVFVKLTKCERKMINKKEKAKPGAALQTVL